MLSDFIGGSFQLTAGAAIVQDAYGRFPLIQMGQDGKAYPVTTSDYAAVANVGQIIAQTSTGSGAMLGGNSNTAVSQGLAPVPVVRNATDGSIFELAPNSSSQGVAIFKYAPGGGLLGSLTLDSTANALHLQGMAQLSNGNFVAAWTTAAAGEPLVFAVFNSLLQLVAGPTTIENSASISAGANLSLIALSGGGFALGWTNASTTRPRLAIYSNAGVVVSAAADVKATSGTYNIKLAQLSSGNIVYAFYNPGASGAGMQFAIYNISGAVVQALSAATGTTNTTAFQCLISVMTGYFAIAFANSSSYLSVNVYNNAGAQQGSTFTPQTTAAMQSFENVFANDGTYFWLFASTSSIGTRLSNIQTSGAVGPVNNVQIAGNYNAYSFAGFIENGYMIVIVGINTGNTSVAVFIVNLNNPTLGVSATNIGSAPGTYGSSNPNIISGGGDFSYIAAYDYQTPASTNFYVGKYANTAIMGAAVSTAAAGALMSTQPNRIGGGTAAYGVSAMLGTSPKAFDHSAATIPGNKGTIMTNGAVLKGM